MDPRTPQFRSNREISIRDDRLEMINQWLLGMDHVRPSNDDLAWHESFWRLAATTIGGGFAGWFIKESYPGGIGDGFNV